MQSKKDSLKETITDVILGYFIALLTQMIVFPLVGIEASFKQNVCVGLYFMVVAIIRKYFIRRFFNKRKIKNDNKN